MDRSRLRLGIEERHFQGELHLLQEPDSINMNFTQIH